MKSTVKVDLNDLPVIEVKFVTLLKVPIDPTNLIVQVERPDGTRPANVTKPDAHLVSTVVGTWNFTFVSPINMAGWWKVKFNASGNITAAEEVWFEVYETTFPVVP